MLAGYLKPDNKDTKRQTLLFPLRIRSVVSIHNFLHQGMAYHVFAGKGVEINALDALQFFPCVFQAGFNISRQVDLADVAGDRCFGAGVVFCASSRITYEPFSVRPRI